MEYQQGINNNELKRKNRGLVLQLICCGRILSRVDVAKKSGLTKMTVTNIVNQFIQDHYLVERKAIATSAPIWKGLPSWINGFPNDSK